MAHNVVKCDLFEILGSSVDVQTPNFATNGSLPEQFFDHSGLSGDRKMALQPVTLRIPRQYLGDVDPLLAPELPTGASAVDRAFGLLAVTPHGTALHPGGGRTALLSRYRHGLTRRDPD